MKITSFNPLIISENAKEIIALFEELGFEQRHHKEDINNNDITAVRMRNEEGFHLDVTDAPVSQTITAIRMNVDDFDEAYQFLQQRGFVNAQGNRITDTGSSKSTLMIAPSGFAISLSHHIKK